MARHATLSSFYNSKIMKKKRWNMKKAMDGEFDKAVDSILKCAGGDSHTKVHGDPNQTYNIIIGNAQFSSVGSLHTSFQSHLEAKLKALGYKVLAVEEDYTSQKCPRCHKQVEQPRVRIKHCTSCNVVYHRDVMAAENMIHIARSMFQTGQRPEVVNNDVSESSSGQSKLKNAGVDSFAN